MSKQDTYACAEIEELLSAYADGELNNEERAAVEKHIGRCPSCAAALAELDALRMAVADAAEDAVPQARVRVAVMRAVAAEPRMIVSAKRTPVWRRWGTVAAAFVCVMVVVIALISGGLLDDVMMEADGLMESAGGNAMAPDMDAEKPMEPSCGAEDHPADGDDTADDSDAADGEINVPAADPSMEPSKVPSDTPGASDSDDGTTADTPTDVPDEAGKVYALKPVYAGVVDTDGALDDMLVGEWVGDGLFLSFAKPEVKVEWTFGDVRLGKYKLHGDRLTITLEGGEVLEFEAYAEEGLLWLTLQ